MPTSLTYLVLETRGCSPWRPDAVMSTDSRVEERLTRIVKDRREGTGHGSQPCVPSSSSPISSSPDSRAQGCDQEKRTLARLPASVSELACVTTGLPSLVQECEPDSLSFFPSVCLCLRTDSPMDLRGSHGNFLHFSLPSPTCFESLLLPPRSARLEVSATLT